MANYLASDGLHLDGIDANITTSVEPSSYGVAIQQVTTCNINGGTYLGMYGKLYNYSGNYSKLHIFVGIPSSFITSDSIYKRAFLIRID